MQRVVITRKKYDEAVRQRTPIRIYRSKTKDRDFWAFRKKVYVTSDQALKPDDVLALIDEAANLRRLRLEKAHSLQAMTRQLDLKAKRQPIPQEVKTNRLAPRWGSMRGMQF